jgi:translocation and assembly module TamB
MTLSSSHKPSRARRVLGVLGSVIGIGVTVVASVAGGVLLHLDLPGTRRVVATQVNGILDSTLSGKIRIEHIGGIGLHGIEGLRVRVHDPDGIQVLHVDGVSVRANAIDAARSALFGKGPIVIDVPSVAVGNVDANLDTDPKGQLRIANAFLPKKPSEPPKPNEPPGRDVRVDVPSVRLGHAWVHGTPPGAPLVDADAFELAGRATLDTSAPTDIPLGAPKGDADPFVSAKLDRVRLVTRALPRRADPKGTIGGTFAMPAPNGHGVAFQAAFDGDIAGIPTTAEAKMSDQRLDARIDAHDRTGAQAGLVVDELAIKEPLTLHAEAHGDLPHVEGLAAVRLGEATVDAHATVDAGIKTRIQGTVSVRNVNAAAAVADAPVTKVGLDARADVTLDGDQIHGEAAIDTLPGTVNQQLIPPVAVRGRFEGESAHVTARVDDKTMPTEVTVDVTPRGGEKDRRTITAAVRSRIPDLHRVPEVGTKVGGSAEVDASVRLLLPEQRFEEAKARVAVSKVKEEELAVGKIEVKARASGTIKHPVIDAELHGSHLITGTLPLASVEGGARIELDDKVVLVRDARVSAVRPIGDTLEAKVRLVRVAGPDLRLEAVEVLGVGEPVRADVTKDVSGIRAKVDAPKIDLSRVARLVGQEALGIEKGFVGVTGEGSVRRGVARGKVRVGVSELSGHGVKGASATVDASIEDRDVELAINANVGPTGNLALTTERLRIDGRADDPRSWKRVQGRVNVDGSVDLQSVTALVPAKSLPVADIRGNVTVRGRVGRDGPEAPPETQLHVHTNGLAVAGRSAPPTKVNGVEIEAPPPWRLSDVDLGLDVRTDGLSGLTDVAVRANDRNGSLVAMNAKAILPFADLIAAPARAQERLVAAPMSVRVVVPSRRLDQLPAIAGIKDARGVVDADLAVTGTALEPEVHLVARTKGVHTSAMPADIDADTDVRLDYDGEKADLAAKVSSHGKELLTAGAHLEARLHDFIDGKKDPAWTASMKAKLAAFPLESVPQLADRRIRGKVSGEVALDDLHRDARVKGRIDLDGLAVGGAEYPKGAITIETGGGKLAAKVRLDQKDGFLDAKATTGLTWGEAVAPSLDPNQPIEASLDAKALRAAALQPFVEGAVPSLDGRIDANAKARLVPGKPGAELSGQVVFRDGTVQIAALGEELRGVRATATFAPDGTIRVNDVFARGTQGEVRADAAVKIDGTRLADATANVNIPERRPLSLAVQGQPIGELSGTIKVKASQSPDAKTTSILVEVPKMAVELPQVMKSGVQSLAPHENVRVGVFRDKQKFVMLPLEKEDLIREEEKAADESKLAVDVRLGRIRIERGNQLRVDLSGNPKVAIQNGQTVLTGQISVSGGWVDVQGKKFEIEKGTVTFNGDVPPDPVVVATAGWSAPDGSRIYADFVGPVKTGKVTLRSEPPRPKNEILAMVLFGTADGANPQPPPGGKKPDGTANAAVGLGGGFVAEGLTEALDDLAGIQATARIDTSRSNNPRPEIEFQLSPKVSVGFAHVIGTPPIAEPDRNYANVEYRFHRNWSLETTFGDRGSALLDAIWQKRY